MVHALYAMWLMLLPPGDLFSPLKSSQGTVTISASRARQKGYYVRLAHSFQLAPSLSACLPGNHEAMLWGGPGHPEKATRRGTGSSLQQAALPCQPAREPPWVWVSNAHKSASLCRITASANMWLQHHEKLPSRTSPQFLDPTNHGR